jgi:hypothetical protein
MSINHEPSSNTNIVRTSVEDDSMVKRAEETGETFCTSWGMTHLTGAELDEWLRQEGNYFQKRSRNVRPDSKRYRELCSRIRLAKAAKVAEVGIFFVVNGVPLVRGIPWTENPSFAGYRTFPMNHPDFWEYLQRRRLRRWDWRYEEVARGRVNYHEKSGKFNLFADRCIIKKKRLVRAILAAFNLPRDTNVVVSDHYQCLGCLPTRPPNPWLDKEWNL